MFYNNIEALTHREWGSFRVPGPAAEGIVKTLSLATWVMFGAVFVGQALITSARQPPPAYAGGWWDLPPPPGAANPDARLRR